MVNGYEDIVRDQTTTLSIFADAPHFDLPKPFQEVIAAWLRLALGRGLDAMPQWT